MKQETGLHSPFGTLQVYFKSLLAALLLAATGTTVNAQWAYYGGTTATPTATYSGSYLDFAVNKAGDGYVFYCESGWSNRGTVAKGNSSGWSIVGTEPCTPNTVAYCKIALDTFGTPFIAYQDGGAGNKITVMKYDGSSWVNVGSAGFSAGTANYISLAVDRSGKPWVAYQDVAGGNKATVKKFDGTSWVTVGSAGFSSTAAYDVSLAVDTTGTPYVAWCDASAGVGVATVMKFNGTGWVPLGSLASFGAHVGKTIIAIDTGAVPYLAFIDELYGDAVIVMKYSATAAMWEYVNPEPVGGPAQHVSMTMGKNGTPYVMFNDGGYGGAATVMQYTGGSWRSAGNLAFSGPGYSINTTGVGTDDAGNVYALWKWSTISVFNQASVSKLDAGTSTIMGTLKACAGDTITLTDGLAGGTWADGGGCLCVTLDPATGKITGHAPGGVEAIHYDAGGYTQVAYFWVMPYADSVTGTASLCAGATTSLADAVIGGTWSSSSSSIASVDASGVVTGLSPGTASVAYTLTDPYGCGVAHMVVTVNTLPAAISGAGDICVGSTLTLTDATPGGTWSSAAPGMATVGASTGIATGLSPGFAAIIYTSAEGCTTSAAINIDPLPAAITGTGTICVGTTHSLGDATSGGIWSSGATTIATVDLTGVVTGVGMGTAMITYTLPTGCYVTTIVTVSCDAGVSQFSAIDLDIYPNPANNELIIRSPEQINEITITNFVGQQVYREAITAHCLLKQIDVSQLPAGAYVVKVNEAVVRKFTKSR